MSGPKRYSVMHDGAFSPDGLVEYEHGPLVSFSDYDRLRRELAEAQRDAARYRWLKDWLTDQKLIQFVERANLNGLLVSKWIFQRPAVIWTAGSLSDAGIGDSRDAAIDAAMPAP